MDEGLEVLWRNATEAWDDDKRHVALLEYALRADVLPDLAGRYRALKDDPEKGAMAKKRIDAIVGAATAALHAMKTPPPPKTNRWLTILTAIVCAATLVYLAWLMLGRR